MSTPSESSPLSGSAGESKRSDPSDLKSRKAFHSAAGPIVFLLMLAVPIESMTYEIRCSIGLVLWMGWWWITRPVHLAVTGFLPLVVVALFNFAPLARILPAYAAETGHSSAYPTQGGKLRRKRHRRISLTSFDSSHDN